MKQKFYPIKLYLKYTPNIIMIGSAAVLNIIAWLWLIFHIGPQDQQIFLHYNVLFGVDLIGDWKQMSNIPAAGLIILIINALCGWLFFKNDKFIAHIFNSLSVIVQIIILIVASLVVFLNV